MKAAENFKWVVPVTFGVGTISELGMELSKRGCRKVLLFHGKSVEKAGFSTKLRALIEAEGIAVVDCNESEPDPTENKVNCIGRMAREAKIDGIVAVGGGSAIDGAKAIKVLVNNPGEIKDYFLGTNKVQLEGVPLIAMPTTAGTGTEVDRVSMITSSEDGSKKVLIGVGAAPDVAIVDPELTTTCPPVTTAGCGFDALGHCIDAATGKLSTDIIRTFAFKAIRLIRENLEKAIVNGNDLDVRTALHMASMLGGVDIANANCSAAHAFAHGMGAAFHVSHGKCVAIFTPACLEFVAEASKHEIKAIGGIIGVAVDESEDPQTAAKKVSEAIYRWYRKCGLPNIVDLIPDQKDALEKIIPLALADVNGRFARRELDAEKARWIVMRTYEMAEELK
ncbi:iron-containing alcohol dehydrogenase [Pseudoramibacter alactolyticus]|uniref:iron-containing alcohol dehydrogenase n=1 Tax=Pseudoramibacter alactolyticus TaxID=113287 RepID=UPI002353B4E4|nr:iron-containing alcohol dehydrogenase [Pseudoramibacter alactolyticus]MBM6968831.1 iron-containing alcohol dehydrogenase [Pseudoramibacter alactolyticus]